MKYLPTKKKMAEMQDLSIDDVLPRSRVGKSDISFEGLVLMITGAGVQSDLKLSDKFLTANQKKLFFTSSLKLIYIQLNQK